MRRVVLAGMATLLMVGAALYLSVTDGDDAPGPEAGTVEATGTSGGAAPDAGADAGGDTGAPGVGSTTPVNTTVAPRGPRGSGEPVTFAFAGDVHFADEWYTEPGITSPDAPTLAEQLRADPKHVLDPVAPVLGNADITVVNLETAITERGEPVAGKNFHFRSPASSFTALKSAGVDVVSMANNHALDYGPVGMEDTFTAIDDAKLPVIGIGRDADAAYAPFRTVVRGQRIAIFSAVDWLEPALVDSWTATDTQAGLAFSVDPGRLVDDVRAARPGVDTLVVFLHWGTEDTWCASSEQQDLAATLLEAGADLVVGSHTHRVFGAGRSGPALVAYGLGNFVYWREDGESGRSGVLLATATGREVDAYSWVPARITNGVATPEHGDAAAAAVAEWERRRACSGIEP
jgi:hypothetical protein